jgi:5-methylcytosine-specific restriction enzyme subunit McrC
MEKLFESYIPALMRRCLANTNAVISTQDTRYHLIEEPTKRFSLRPDIVLTVDQKTYIMDTKWKRLSSDSSIHYGISQSDMYQMYAYYHRYTANGNDVDSVTLIYPAMPSIKGNIDFCTDDKKTKIRICFIDLYKAENDDDENSVKSLMKDLEILK